MTWSDLTFTASHVLTASDMNRVQANFAALAAGAAGAPAIAVDSLTVSGVASVATLNVSSQALLGGGSVQFKDERGAAGGYASLDAGGLVPPAEGGVPTGCLMAYVGTTAPAGWLLCNGDSVGEPGSGADHEGAAYAALFTLLKSMPPNLGTESFEGGDTVVLPDLRGRVAIGLDDLGGADAARIDGAQIPERSSDNWDETLGGTAGEALHPLSVAELPAHGHDIRATVGAASATGRVARGDTGSFSDLGNPVRDTGGDTAHNTMQPSIALAYIVKA